MPVRRALAVLPAALALVASAAAPAHAVGDACVTHSAVLSSVTVCVDVSGSERAAYVTATALLHPALLELYADLKQCSATTGCTDVDHGSDWTSDPDRLVYRGTPWTYSFGHTYQTCVGDLQVQMGTPGLGGWTDRYDDFCSGSRVN